MQTREPTPAGPNEYLQDSERRRGWFPPERADFLQRVLIVAGIGAALVLGGALLWTAAHVLLLLFAGVLFAVALRSLSDWVHEYTALSDGWSLTVVVLGLLMLLGLGAWLLAPRLAGQLDQLTQQIPQYECSIVQMESQADRFDLPVVKLPVG